MQQDLQSQEFWSELCPELQVSLDETTLSPEFPLEEGLQENAQALLHREGYTRLENIFPTGLCGRLAMGVEKLHSAGLPAVWLFVFDEAWKALAHLDPFLSRILGKDYQRLPEFWAWRVGPGQAGWTPHRDKQRLNLDAEGKPLSLTLWIALLDATPENGCMYVLPASRDPHRSLWPESLAGDLLQDIRALPARAGTALLWDHSLLHWGGRASSTAPNPRISLSCEFQSVCVRPFSRPLSPPLLLPSFETRLNLLARQVLEYQKFTDLTGEVLDWAQQRASFLSRLRSVGQETAQWFQKKLGRVE